MHSVLYQHKKKVKRAAGLEAGAAVAKLEIKSPEVARAETVITRKQHASMLLSGTWWSRCATLDHHDASVDCTSVKPAAAIQEASQLPHCSRLLTLGNGRMRPRHFDKAQFSFLSGICF